jgi:hypothetical protein
MFPNEAFGVFALRFGTAVKLAYDLRNVAYNCFSPDTISVILVDLRD